MAVAKEQVTKATVFAMEQVVMAVVRAVMWCVRWCGEVRSRGSQADAELCSQLWFPSPLRGNTPHPEVGSSPMPGCKGLVSANYLRGGLINMCRHVTSHKVNRCNTHTSFCSIRETEGQTVLPVNIQPVRGNTSARLTQVH